MSEPLHTYCKCELCGATVRASRHSETDCETIREQKTRIRLLEGLHIVFRDSNPETGIELMVNFLNENGFDLDALYDENPDQLGRNVINAALAKTVDPITPVTSNLTHVGANES